MMSSNVPASILVSSLDLGLCEAVLEWSSDVVRSNQMKSAKSRNPDSSESHPDDGGEGGSSKSLKLVNQIIFFPGFFSNVFFLFFTLSAAAATAAADKVEAEAATKGRRVAFNEY